MAFGIKIAQYAFHVSILVRAELVPNVPGSRWPPRIIYASVQLHHTVEQLPTSPN